MATNFQKYFFPYKIGQGSEGLVYRISNKHAAKVPRESSGRGNLKKESRIAEILFEEGVSVPKPEGIFKIRNLDLISSVIPAEAFVMEYIAGKTGFEFFSDSLFFKRDSSGFVGTPSFLKHSEEYAHVKNLHDEEIKKARELGFLSFDAEFRGNFIWSPERDRVYLIDFGMWEWEV